MGIFSRWTERAAERIAGNVVDGMVASGEMGNIVRNAMADEFEKLSHEPKYAHCADRLRRMAVRARQQST